MTESQELGRIKRQIDEKYKDVAAILMKWIDNGKKTNDDIVGMFIKYGKIHPDYYKPRIKSSISKSSGKHF